MIQIDRQLWRFTCIIDAFNLESLEKPSFQHTIM